MGGMRAWSQGCCARLPQGCPHGLLPRERLRGKLQPRCAILLHAHVASGLLLSTGRPSDPAPPLALFRYLAKATQTRLLPSQRKGEEDGWAQARPAPCAPAPAVFQLVLQPCQELLCSIAAASRVGVQNPQRTRAALSWISDCWPTRFTRCM